MVLVEAGARVTIVDDLSNSFREVLSRMRQILGPAFERITYEEVRIKFASLATCSRRQTWGRSTDAGVHAFNCIPALRCVVPEALYHVLKVFTSAVAARLGIRRQASLMRSPTCCRRWT